MTPESSSPKPSQDDMTWVFGHVAGFRFNFTKSYDYHLSPLFSCTEFTSGLPSSQGCSPADYVVRFENNTAVFLKALLFFKEFWGTHEYFGILKGVIPSLAKSPRSLNVLQSGFREARAAYIRNNAGFSASSEIVSLVDRWSKVVDNAPRHNSGRQMSASQRRSLQTAKASWARMKRKGEFIDAGRSIYAADVSRRGRSSRADTPQTRITPSPSGSPSESSGSGIEPTRKRQGALLPERRSKRQATDGRRSDGTRRNSSLGRGRSSSCARVRSPDITDISVADGHRSAERSTSGLEREIEGNLRAIQEQTRTIGSLGYRVEQLECKSRATRDHLHRLEGLLPRPGDTTESTAPEVGGIPASLAERTVSLEKSVGEISESLKNREKYIAKAVKRLEPALLETMREGLKVDIATQVSPEHQKLSKKIIRLRKRVTNSAQSFAEGFGERVQTVVDQEIEKRLADGAIGPRSESGPELQISFEDLTKRVQSLERTLIQPPPTGPSRESFNQVLRRLDAIEGRLARDEQSGPQHFLYGRLESQLAEHRDIVGCQERTIAKLSKEVADLRSQATVPRGFPVMNPPINQWQQRPFSSPPRHY